MNALDTAPAVPGVLGQATIANTVWLWLLKEGGRSTVREIQDGTMTHKITPVLHDLAQRDCLVKYGRESTGAANVTFGVTSTCRVPRGLSLEQILDAALVPRERRRV